MANNAGKEYRKLRKMLIKAGFTEGDNKKGHVVYRKDGIPVTVAKSVRDSAGLFRLNMRQWEKDKAAKN